MLAPVSIVRPPERVAVRGELTHHQLGRGARPVAGERGDIAKGVPVLLRAGKLRFVETVADVLNDFAMNGRKTHDQRSAGSICTWPRYSAGAGWGTSGPPTSGPYEGAPRGCPV